jgi:hypothetical protein
MPLSLLLLPILAAAAEPASAPITVTGHAWAPFISPMGEPFRARSTSENTLAKWLNQADRNRDGHITADEMQADAERFFATLDTDGNREIGPEELIRYEWEVAPEIQVNSKRRRTPEEASRNPQPKEARQREDDPDRHLTRSLHEGLQGGARYALLNIPEPVAAADADLNRAITLGEFRQAAAERFQLLDSARKGRLTLQDLEARRFALDATRSEPRRRGDKDRRYGTPIPLGN